MAAPLATVGELENYLQKTFTDAAPATQAILLASGAVRTYCGWVLSEELGAVMEVYGDGSAWVTLPTLCLNNVEKIAIDDVYLPDPPARTVDLMWSRKGQIFRRECWRDGAVVTVHLDHGYNPIPDVLKLVTLDLASRQMVNPQGWKSASTSQVSISYGPNDLTDLHRNLLDQHRVFL